MFWGDAIKHADIVDDFFELHLIHLVNFMTADCLLVNRVQADKLSYQAKVKKLLKHYLSGTKQVLTTFTLHKTRFLRSLPNVFGGICSEISFSNVVFWEGRREKVNNYARAKKRGN